MRRVLAHDHDKRSILVLLNLEDTSSDQFGAPSGFRSRKTCFRVSLAIWPSSRGLLKSKCNARLTLSGSVPRRVRLRQGWLLQTSIRQADSNRSSLCRALTATSQDFIGNESRRSLAASETGNFCGLWKNHANQQLRRPDQSQRPRPDSSGEINFPKQAIVFRALNELRREKRNE